MLQLPNSKHIIHGDTNYTYAANYRHLYNAPVTLNFGEKHNRTKYILSAGSSDNIELWQDSIFIYVVAQNNTLSYISLQVINTENKEIEGEVYLNEQDCTFEENMSAGILDIESKQQIKILCEYL
jgi:Ca2+-dependent lipid-binding protein